MAKTARLRVEDYRAIWKLTGECREMGDDRIAWRDHCVSELARLVDADMGVVGEMGGCRSLSLKDLGASYWCQLSLPAAEFVDPLLHEFRQNPGLSTAMIEYHRRNRENHGNCLTRQDLIEDRDWFRMDEIRVVNESFGTDATLWCFRQIPGAETGENAGIVLSRARRRRNFDLRERAIIVEANTAIAPLLGHALARTRDSSPSELPPRVRQVLVCLLEGDSDKQIALRLHLGKHTVNEYTKVIFRHFRVSGRSQLLARWISRGWGNRFAWVDAEPVDMIRKASEFRVNFSAHDRV